MTLTPNGKNYIAAEFGINNCFVKSGFAWNTIDINDVSTPETGGTAKIVSRLVTTAAIKKIDITSPKTKSYVYADLKAGNDGTDVDLAIDAVWVANNDEAADPNGVYCAAAATPTPTPPPVPTGTADALIATLPGGAAYWLDKDPAQDPATGITKEMTDMANIIKTKIAVPAKHCIHYRLTGYKNVDLCENVPAEAVQWGLPLEAGYLVPELGADVDSALLTVQAFKDEAKTVEIQNGIVRLGASFFGFTPTTKPVAAPPTPGKKYTVSISADGREDASTEVTMVKTTPQIVKVYMKQSGKITVKISPAIAFIGDLSGGAYQVWYVGAKQTGYVRVDTGIIGRFRAVLKFDPPNIPPIYTQAKVLTPNMGANDRRLYWPYLNDGKYLTPTDWIVPNKPGEYIITGELFVEVI